MKTVSTEKHEVLCENSTISYLLTRKPVKNVNLRIKPDGRVLVSANNRVPIDFIDKFIRQKENFILSALAKYEEKQKLRQDIPKQYVSGETFVLLGKSLELIVEESEDEMVYTDGTYIFLKVMDKDEFCHKEIMVAKWLKQYQMQVFHELIEQTYERFSKYDVPFPILKIRTMKSQWGSCRPERGIITLNSRLIEMPRSCIEYVVVHEFAHFIYPNHSKQFWDFVTMMMPDWKERRKELEERG